MMMFGTTTRSWSMYFNSSFLVQVYCKSKASFWVFILRWMHLRLRIILTWWNTYRISGRTWTIFNIIYLKLFSPSSWLKKCCIEIELFNNEKFIGSCYTILKTRVFKISYNYVSTILVCWFSSSLDGSAQNDLFPNHSFA